MTGKPGHEILQKLSRLLNFDKVVKLTVNDYNAMKNAVVTIDPIAVTVASDHALLLLRD